MDRVSNSRNFNAQESTGGPDFHGQARVYSALPQMPEAQDTFSGEGLAIERRHVQSADQIIHDLSVILHTLRTRELSIQELTAFIRKLDTLRGLDHADILYYVDQAKNIIPLPESFRDEWVKSGTPICDFLAGLVRRRLCGPDYKPHIYEKKLSSQSLKEIFTFLNILDHAGVDELYTLAYESLYLFRNHVENDVLFTCAMTQGKSRRNHSDEPGQAQPQAAVNSSVLNRSLQGESLQSLQQQAKDATRRNDSQGAFLAYQRITEEFSFDRAAQKAWLEMTWMCIFDELCRDILPPERIVEKLIEYTLKGDMGARLQLESISECAVYQDEYIKQNGYAAIRRIVQSNNEEFDRLNSAPAPSGYRSFGDDDSWKPEFDRQDSSISQGSTDEDVDDPALAICLPSLAAARRGERGGGSFAAYLSIKPTQELLRRNENDAHIPLFQRVRQWESGHHSQFSQRTDKKPADIVFIKTLNGDTITLRQVDMNGPVADLCMKLCEKGYPLCESHLLFMGGRINDNEHLLTKLGSGGIGFTGSTLHIVPRTQDEVNGLKRALKCHRVETVGGQISYVPLMPEEINSPEKIESVLLSLYQSKSEWNNSKTPMNVTEFLKLRSYIQNALQCLAASGSVVKTHDVGVEELDGLGLYLNLVNSCLDLYKTPFVDNQNSHVTKLIEDTLQKQQVIQSSIHHKIENIVPDTCCINFGENPVSCNKQILAARCIYIARLHEFSSDTQEVDFSGVCHSEKVRNTFKLYLLAGRLDQVNELTASEVVSLFKVANQYQAIELEKQCLLLILEGIKYNLFTIEEMQNIMTFIVIDKIREAVSPLFEFQTIEQGGGQQSLRSLQKKRDTRPRAPSYSFDMNRRCLSLGVNPRASQT